MMNKVTSLPDFISNIRIMKAAAPTDLSIAICDTEKFLAYIPGKEIRLPIYEGQRLQQDEPLMLALRRNERLESIVPAQFYGFEFVGTATPLHNDVGEVIGGVAIQVRKQRELIDASATLETSLFQVNEQLQHIFSGATSLTQMTNTLHTHSEEAMQRIDSSTEMLAIIEKMTVQTNVLGLNASIEAARAGEYGRGFSVVAKEIQHFSQQSAQNAKQIREMIQQLQQHIEQMNEMVERVANIGQTQEQSLTDVTDIMNCMEHMSKQLHIFAQKL